jgi:uncharacterized protein (TIRG00374 family)
MLPINEMRDRPASWRRWVRPIVGLVITGIFVSLVLDRLPYKELPQALAVVDWILILPALMCLALGYTARIVRWWRMLQAATPTLRLRETAAPFLTGIAANNVLPLRAGDILRLFAFPGRPGAEPSRVGGTLIVERLLDLLALLFILMVVLPFIPMGDPVLLSRLAMGSAVLGLVGLAGLFSLPLIRRLILVPLGRHGAVQKSGLAGKLLTIAMDLTGTIIALGSPRRLAALIALSAIAWILEGGVFLSVAAATGIEGGWGAAYLALAMATLSTLIPSSPGYVGTFHFFAMQAALFFGNPDAKAGVFAIVVHLMLWLPTTMAGAAAFAWTSVAARSAKSQL